MPDAMTTAEEEFFATGLYRVVPAETPEEFRQMIEVRSEPLLQLSRYVADHPSTMEFLTRPLLGALVSEASQMEEFLDSIGARTNARWYPMRSLVAALKLFGDTAYEALHIHWSLGRYKLLAVKHDFVVATSGVAAFCGDIIARVCNDLLNLADHMGMAIPTEPPNDAAFIEMAPTGRLPSDRERGQAETVDKTVTRLATAFLNLDAESELVHSAARAAADEYALMIPEPVSEESLRKLQDRFHSLQSLYDTYVSGTSTEELDADLLVLRGHITVAYHLLSIATKLCHFYQRHLCPDSTDSAGANASLVNPDALLEQLMSYSMGFASLYLEAAQSLCHAMLKRYASQGRVDVGVPRYRGFHVRPSTLVAKIVMHYGSDVTMRLEDEEYDAGCVLDIFRANEKINAWKRHWLASQIGNLDLMSDQACCLDFPLLVKRVVLELAEKRKVMLYDMAFEVPAEPAMDEGTPLERVVAEIARMQATGKIDIVTDLKVTFVGDKRVLRDIRLLAECGYGEDNFGNNIPLPKELSYLRRGTS